MGLTVNEAKTKYMVMSTSKTRRAPQSIKLGNRIFEGMSQFKYLGALINSECGMTDCVKDRIQARNRAYYANIQLFRNQLTTVATKMTICRTLVRPVITYGAETWTMTTDDENALRSFERKILRRIYGPLQDQVGWRIRYNQELCELIKGQDLIRFIKMQRLRWLGHLERMPESQMPKRMLRGRLHSRRKKGRPRKRWMDSVIADLGVMGVREWRSKAADGESWRGIVQAAEAHHGL
jgi:hypothetical protein